MSALWRAHWGKAAGALVAGAAIIVASVWANSEAADREAYRSKLLAENSRIIDCTTPGMPCFEEAQRRQRQTLASAFGEIDCLARRIHAELPEYDPRRGTCATQTPPDIYSLPGAS